MDDRLHVMGYTELRIVKLCIQAVADRRRILTAHQQNSMTNMGTAGLPDPRSTAETAWLKASRK